MKKSSLTIAILKSQDFKGEKNSKDPGFVEYVMKNNIIHTIEVIKAKNPY
jgi:carbonic anhydrase